MCMLKTTWNLACMQRLIDDSGEWASDVCAASFEETWWYSSEPCALWLFNDFKTSSTYSTVTGVNSSRVGMSTGGLGRTSSDGLAGSQTTVANVAVRSDIVALGKDLTFSRLASLFRICHWALGLRLWVLKAFTQYSVLSFLFKRVPSRRAARYCWRRGPSVGFLRNFLCKFIRS